MVCPGGHSPVEAYVGIKQAYQGILGEYLVGWAYQALTSHKESTESHSGSVCGRARKSGLEEVIDNLSIVIVSLSPPAFTAYSAGAISVTLAISVSSVTVPSGRTSSGEVTLFGEGASLSI
jgi:hypothetical protein